MAQNLLKKTLLVVALVLVCLAGIVGVPSSWKGIRQNLQERIHLGLDLRGGTHLVLQVMVNEALNSEADQTIERLKDALKKRQVSYASLTRIDAANIHDDGG